MDPQATAQAGETIPIALAPSIQAQAGELPLKALKFDNPQMVLYMKSMGKLFRVTAICRSEQEANKLMEKDRNQTLIACDSSGLHYLANAYGSVCPSALIKDEP